MERERDGFIYSLPLQRIQQDVKCSIAQRIRSIVISIASPAYGLFYLQELCRFI